MYKTNIIGVYTVYCNEGVHCNYLSKSLFYTRLVMV